MKIKNGFVKLKLLKITLFLLLLLEVAILLLFVKMGRSFFHSLFLLVLFLYGFDQRFIICNLLKIWFSFCILSRKQLNQKLKLMVEAQDMLYTLTHIIISLILVGLWCNVLPINLFFLCQEDCKALFKAFYHERLNNLYWSITFIGLILVGLWWNVFAINGFWMFDQRFNCLFWALLKISFFFCIQLLAYFWWGLGLWLNILLINYLALYEISKALFLSMCFQYLLVFSLMGIMKDWIFFISCLSMIF